MEVRANRLSARFAETRKVENDSDRSLSMTALLSAANIWLGQIERQPMGERKVGDPEDSCEPFLNGLVRNLVRQDYANPAAKIFDASDTEIFQGPLDISYEPLLEIVPVAAFEGEFVVVDDRASHERKT